MASVNDAIADALTGRSVTLERLKAGTTEELMSFLRELETELVIRVARLDPTGAARLSTQRSRLQTLLEEVRELIRTAYASLARAAAEVLRRASVAEARATLRAMERATRGRLGMGLPDLRTLRSLASGVLVDGSPTKKWWEKQAGDAAFRFEREMQKGVAAGETVDQLVRRVRGTQKGGFRDGIMQASRSGAEALVRSSVSAAVHEARLETFRANDDVVKGVQWRSTLDGRTSPVCRALDGLAWTLDGDPIGHDRPMQRPPAHWGCRSTLTSVLKPWEDLDPRLKNKIKDDEKTRASMDGQVPASTTYEEWLRGKSEEFQRRVLGPGRLKLWREGKLSLAQMVDQRGSPLTIDQLEKEAS